MFEMPVKYLETFPKLTKLPKSAIGIGYLLKKSPDQSCVRKLILQPTDLVNGCLSGFQDNNSSTALAT